MEQRLRGGDGTEGEVYGSRKFTKIENWKWHAFKDRTDQIAGGKIKIIKWSIVGHWDHTFFYSHIKPNIKQATGTVTKTYHSGGFHIALHWSYILQQGLLWFYETVSETVPTPCHHMGTGSTSVGMLLPWSGRSHHFGIAYGGGQTWYV